MLSVSHLLLVLYAAAVAFASAVPAEGLERKETTLERRAGTPSSAGYHDGFYYSWWTDNGAYATYTNGPRGQFSISWGTGGNLVGKCSTPCQRNMQ